LSTPSTTLTSTPQHHVVSQTLHPSKHTIPIVNPRSLTLPSGGLNCVVIGCKNLKEQENYCKEHFNLFKNNNNTNENAKEKKNLEQKDKEKKQNILKNNEKGANIDGTTLLSQLKSTWHEAKAVVHKDLPRLAKRMVIEDEHKNGVVEYGLLANEKKGEITTWNSVCNVVNAIASRLETKQKYDTVKQGLEELSKNIESKGNSQSDLEACVETLHSKSLGYDSKTAKIFKICHQAVLFPAIFYLQSKLFSQIGHMKDVRREDGWTIRIYLGDAIYVTHTRWEQNLSPAEADDHFEVCWELRCSFDKGMEDLRAVFLRINDLRFMPNVKSDFKEKVTNVLRGSGYII